MAICLPHVELAGVAVGAFLQWPPRALESFGLLGLELNPPQFRGPPPQFRGRQITFDLELYSAPPGLFLKTCRQTYSNKDLILCKVSFQRKTTQSFVAQAAQAY